LGDNGHRKTEQETTTQQNAWQVDIHVTSEGAAGL